MIGQSNSKSGGTTTQSQALKTGSKDHASGYTGGREDVGKIFESLYDFKQAQKEQKTTQKTQEADESLISEAISGNRQAAATILKQLDPTINAAISSMAGNDSRYKTRARLMTLAALKDYDPRQGTALSTYVYNRLQGLRRLSADRGNFIHVPEKSALEKRQLEAIKSDYILENGVEPSLGELADRSGMSVRKVGRLMSIFGATSTSATRGEHGDSLEAKPRTATELYNDAFYLELPETDKKIYEWSTGYRGSPMLDRATMAKRLKISEAAVSQHAKKIDQRAAAFNRIVSKDIYGDSYYGGTE